MENIPITMIAAVTHAGGLGLQGKLLVEDPLDQAWLRARCHKKPLIMGRKTFENLPPLPEAHIIVLSRTKRIPGVSVASSRFDALKEAHAYLQKNPCVSQEIMILGGGEIYRLFLSVATGLDITQFDKNLPFDVAFPDIPYDAFPKVVSFASPQKHVLLSLFRKRGYAFPEEAPLVSF